MRTRRGFAAFLLALMLALTGCLAPAGTHVAGSASDATASSTPTVYDAAAPTVYDAEDPTITIELVMVGDVLVHEGVWTSGELPDGTYDYSHLFAQVAPGAQAADLALLNQETVLGGRDLGLSGYPMFNSPQEIGDAEVDAGFNVICSATNHTLDKGAEGLARELAYWRDRHPEVAVIGAADSQETYDDIYVYEKDGFRVAVLNYTFSTNGIPIPADNPWAVHMLDEDAVRADVARAQGMADLVVVCPHWGTEYQAAPDALQARYANLFCELGVDIVIGTHPHCLGPVEVKTRDDGHKTLVYYSLGNFISTQGQHELTAVGGIARVVMAKDGDSAQVERYELAPTVTHMERGERGEAFTTYKLADYTDELAAVNPAGIGRQACEDLCTQVLGDAYDEKACVLAGTL